MFHVKRRTSTRECPEPDPWHVSRETDAQSSHNKLKGPVSEDYAYFSMEGTALAARDGATDTLKAGMDAEVIPSIAALVCAAPS